MIGVGENDRSAQFFERFLRQPFDSGRRAHGHERRRLNHTVRCAELAPPRGRRRVLLLYFKRKTHPVSVSGENPSPPYAAHHVNGAADAAFFGVRWLATAFTPVTSPRRLAKPRNFQISTPRQFRHRRQQLLRVWMRRTVQDLLYPAHFHELPSPHHRYPRPHLPHNPQALRDKYVRQPKLLLQLLQQKQHLRANRNVQRGDRLAPPEEPGPQSERASQHRARTLVRRHSD